GNGDSVRVRIGHSDCMPDVSDSGIYVLGSGSYLSIASFDLAKHIEGSVARAFIFQNSGEPDPDAPLTGMVPPPPGAGGARLPRVGTPARAAIEAARRRGIAGAQARELGSILRGGKGSGVWTEAELEQIRRTGQFPSDVRWHHDPTVANRPDLAG